MGSRHNYALFGEFFAFFESSCRVVDCDWWKNFSENGTGFSFFFSRLVFYAKQRLPSPPNDIIVGF